MSNSAIKIGDRIYSFICQRSSKRRTKHELKSVLDALECFPGIVVELCIDVLYKIHVELLGMQEQKFHQETGTSSTRIWHVFMNYLQRIGNHQQKIQMSFDLQHLHDSNRI